MKGTSTLYSDVMPVAYRAPTRPLATDGWKNALSNGTLNHLPSQDVRNLSGIYGQIDALGELQGREAEAGAALSPLALNRHLNSSDRTHMLATLAEVDRLNGLMALNSRQLIDAVQTMHFGFSIAEVSKVRSTILNEQHGFRGRCVTDLPLDLG